MSNQFDEAIKKSATAAVAGTMNPEAGQVMMHRKRSAAASKHTDKVEAARRIARELGQYGPVSIDDLQEKLVATGHDTLHSTPAGRRLWKGAVFATDEWVAVGTTPSKVVANHARPVRTWALKSWLNSNSMNGTQHPGSEFDVFGILNDFRRANPGVDPTEDCTWIIGEQRLSSETKHLIKSEKGKLYGVPVQIMTGGIGAMIYHFGAEMKNGSALK